MHYLAVSNTAVWWTSTSCQTWNLSKHCWCPSEAHLSLAIHKHSTPYHQYGNVFETQGRDKNVCTIFALNWRWQVLSHWSVWRYNSSRLYLMHWNIGGNKGKHLSKSSWTCTRWEVAFRACYPHTTEWQCQSSQSLHNSGISWEIHHLQVSWLHFVWRWGCSLSYGVSQFYWTLRPSAT